MKSDYIPSVTLHQQDGGLSIQAFAVQEGLTPIQVQSLAKRGLILGARKDSRSKKWTIYPPAKLMQRPRTYKPRDAAAGFAVGDTPLSQISANAPAAQRKQGGLSVEDFGQHVPPVKAEGNHPSKGGFNAFNGFKDCSEAMGAEAPISEQHSAKLPDVYTSAEGKNVRRVLQDAAARAHREGRHYLRLDSGEFSQLYAALDRERCRIRKLVGKGLVDVGNLRASDSVWQKLQAMCHEGRLL